jgi:hypothetical protein
MTYHVTGPTEEWKTAGYFYYTTWYQGNLLTGYNYKLTDGEDTIGFFKKKRRGDLLPINDFEQHEQRLLYNHGMLDIKDGNQTQVFSSTDVNTSYRLNGAPASYLVDIPYLVGLHDQFNEELVCQRAAANLLNGSFDTITFLAELGKTLDLFGSLLKRTRSLLAASRPSEWANLWLEGRYGWRLLLYDIRNIEDLLASLEEADTQFFRARSGDSRSINESWVSDSWSGAPVSHVTTKSVYGSHSIRGTAICKIVRQKLGFSPIEAAWELTPWSFVIDWILSVGTALAALRVQLTTENLVMGIGYDTAVHVSLTSVSTPSAGYSGSGHGSTLAFQKSTYRTPCELSVIPQVELRLDGNKILDLVALILKSFGK